MSDDTKYFMFILGLALLAFVAYGLFTDWFNSCSDVPTLAIQHAIGYCEERNGTFTHFENQGGYCGWVCSKEGG